MKNFTEEELKLIDKYLDGLSKSKPINKNFYNSAKEKMKVRFEWDGGADCIGPPPFNGEFIDMDRVPALKEKVCFDKVNYYRVVDVITELRGWKGYYTVVLG